ncbi:MAG: hypothetical protein HYV26_17115 [Candidatus Hydrogenedentes bacterium]|nr:hypothetical protein [Candidatus Hydrogenedentota bacterium]
MTAMLLGANERALKALEKQSTDIGGHNFEKCTFKLAEGVNTKDLNRQIAVQIEADSEYQVGMVMYFAVARAVPVAAAFTEGETVLWQ